MTSFARNTALSLIFAAQIAHADLYLLTAAPNINGLGAPYPASLLRVGPQGEVTQTREIASADPGIYWVGVSYEERKAVFVADNLPTPPSIAPRMIIVDFDKADVVKSCDLQGRSEFRAGFWLAAQPGMGLSLEWDAQPDYKDHILSGMLVDPSIPCEKSIWKPLPEDMRYMVAHGAAGVAGRVSHDTYSYIGVNLRLGDGTVDAFVGQLVPLGYKIPLSLRKGFEDPTGLMANNADVFCMSLASKVVFFRKADQTWHEWKTSSRAAIRAFGKYLAGTETRLGGQSAGREEWRSDEASKRGPPTLAVTQGLGLPGRLLIYDTESEREFSILTNQGDSEVILIQDGVVYYRAATRLYSAPLTKEGIGAARLVATSELIRDAHWAFIKP